MVNGGPRLEPARVKTKIQYQNPIFGGRFEAKVLQNARVC